MLEHPWLKLLCIEMRVITVLVRIHKPLVVILHPSSVASGRACCLKYSSTSTPSRRHLPSPELLGWGGGGVEVKSLSNQPFSFVLSSFLSLWVVIQFLPIFLYVFLPLMTSIRKTTLFILKIQSLLMKIILYILPACYFYCLLLFVTYIYIGSHFLNLLLVIQFLTLLANFSIKSGEIRCLIYQLLTIISIKRLKV